MRRRWSRNMCLEERDLEFLERHEEGNNPAHL